MAEWKPGRALSQPRELAISIPEDYLQDVHLLDGGRWLLFGAHDGSVKYHDPNAPGETSQAITLVSSHFDRDANTFVLVSVDLDPDRRIQHSISVSFHGESIVVTHPIIPTRLDLSVGLKSAEYHRIGMRMAKSWVSELNDLLISVKYIFLVVIHLHLEDDM
jgi:hypothetical protein